MGAVLTATVWLAAVAHAQTRLDVAESNTWWGQVPIMLAVDKSYFKEQGIDTELRNIPAPGDRIAALTAGSVVCSTLGRIAAIVETARGNQSFYFFANTDDSPGNEGMTERDIQFINLPPGEMAGADG